MWDSAEPRVAIADQRRHRSGVNALTSPTFERRDTSRT
jgi:hypothetical protein